MHGASPAFVATAACHFQEARSSTVLGSTQGDPCSLQMRVAQWPGFSKVLHAEEGLIEEDPLCKGSDTPQHLCPGPCGVASGVPILPPLSVLGLPGLPGVGNPHRCGCCSPGQFPDPCGHRRHAQPGRGRNYPTFGRSCLDLGRYR